MKKVKNKIVLFFLSLFISSISYAAGLEEYQAFLAKENATPIQEKYDSLSEFIPGYIMLQSGTTSVIPVYIADEFQKCIYRTMVNTEKMKPVSLDKWLMNKYGLEKAQNSRDFIYTLADERYPCLVTGVCQPFIMKSSDGYMLMLSFYRFSDNGFPITVVRSVKSLNLMAEALEAMINEYNTIIENKITENIKKYKIIVKPFVLESRTYIGQSSGEFDYILSSFIEQDGVTIKPEDDMFSRLFSYLLYTTEMVKAVSTIELEQFVKADSNSYEYADYIVEGRVQLTDQINIFHISFIHVSPAKYVEKMYQID